jgi:eukaryotic-like serine/threonine-protein kinase
MSEEDTKPPTGHSQIGDDWDEPTVPPEAAPPAPVSEQPVAPPPPVTAPPVTGTPVTTVTQGLLVAGTYMVEQLINRGGMGEVYRGKNIHTGDPVAMKIVLPALAQDEMIEELFRKEAKVLGRLAHDAIVRYHTYMNPPEIGRPSLIMEFVEGKSLSDRIKEGPMPEEEVRILLRRLASGLGRAHEAGVVHRDLSPDNIILAHEQVENAKIIDFGIAKSSMKGDKTLLGGQFAGKFGFVAPEQLGAYHGTIDGRTDIYSLGLLMVGACRGKTLKMGASIVEAVKSRSSVPDLSDVYEGLRPLFSHMLQPDPEHRPATMAVVIDLLDHPENIPDESNFVDAQDEDRTMIAPALSKAEVANLKKEAASATPEPKIEMMGIPSSKPEKPVEAKKSGKGGMIGILLVLLIAGGGGGAYFSGMLGPKPDTPIAQPEASAEPTAQPEAEPAPIETASAPEPAAPPPTPEPEPQPEPEPTPAAPEPAPTPTPEPVAEPAPPPLQGLGAQVAWLKDYDAGACTHVSLVSTNGDKVQLEGFGTSVDPFSTLLDSFTAAHGVEPDIGVRLIDANQCPVLDFMNAIKENRGIIPSLILDNSSDILKSGETVSGRIEGLAGRSVALFLVNGAGGSTNLKPWMSRSSDGTLGFSFTVNLAAGAEPTPQMILAVVTERPVEKLDAVPNGVTARALIPFMQNELENERQTALGSLRYFRLEN